MLLLADDTEAFAQAIRAASALALNMTTTACRTGRCPVRASVLPRSAGCGEAGSRCLGEVLGS